MYDVCILIRGHLKSSCLALKLLPTPRYPVTWKTDAVHRHALFLFPQAEISELQQLLASKDAEIECLQTQLLARGGTANDNAERGTHSRQSDQSLQIHIRQCGCVRKPAICMSVNSNYCNI